MTPIPCALGLSLLLQGFMCGVAQPATRGCELWKPRGDHVCCDACLPGNRLVRECGPRPSELCAPCEPSTYTVKPKTLRCSGCTQCVGAQVQVRGCTAASDTQCGCKDGLTCGDDVCSFCVTTCGAGHEPTENRSCRPCPNGTFNDRGHRKCEPWSARCPKQDEDIVAEGDAFNDIKCGLISPSPVRLPERPDDVEETWPLVLSVITSVTLLTFGVIVIFIVIIKISQKKKEETKTTITKTPIIRTPTDDPRTLIAIECSFHDPEPEQGRSSESLSRPLSEDWMDGRQMG
ncbi:tumor necrosis factor receptor superfamily member 9a [Brachionichthys hirsutus]|uniref:tumor necrosis factor receptor superfamily member 9a n=1 Tax=Brachionichthys hirsutus TaxID=412623 RepID=UPI0036045831